MQLNNEILKEFLIDMQILRMAVLISLLSILLNFSLNIGLSNIINVMVIKNMYLFCHNIDG